MIIQDISNFDMIGGDIWITKYIGMCYLNFCWWLLKHGRIRCWVFYGRVRTSCCLFWWRLYHKVVKYLLFTLRTITLQRELCYHMLVIQGLAVWQDMTWGHFSLCPSIGKYYNICNEITSKTRRPQTNKLCLQYTKQPKIT